MRYFVVATCVILALATVAIAEIKTTGDDFGDITKEYENNPVRMKFDFTQDIAIIFIFEKSVKKGDSPIAAEVRELSSRVPLQFYKMVNGEMTLVWENTPYTQRLIKMKIGI